MTLNSNRWAQGTLLDIVKNNGLLSDGDWVETKDQDPNGDVRLIQLADIKDSYFLNKSSRYLNSRKAVTLNCTYLQAGDILIARMPDPLGRACIYPGNVPSAVTVVDVCIVRVDSKQHNSKWLMYFINSPQFRNEIHIFQSGTTRKRISKKNISKIPLPIPQLKEQNLIVQEIETQFTRLDAARKLLESIRKKLDVYRNSVLKAAFKGELIKLQGGLVDRTLSEEFEIIMGQSPKSKYYNKSGEGLPFFQGKKEFSKLYPKIETWSTKASKIAGKGDVLLSIRAPIGPVNIAPSKCGIGRGLAAIKSNEKTRSKLIFYLLQILKNELKKRGTGTTFKAITKPNLYSLSIKLPKIKEDRDLLLKKIEFHFSVIDKIEQTVDSALLKSEQLRKSILKSAFEGRLVKYESGSHD